MYLVEVEMMVEMVVNMVVEMVVEMVEEKENKFDVAIQGPLRNLLYAAFV